jgi:hypothetical protein
LWWLLDNAAKIVPQGLRLENPCTDRYYFLTLLLIAIVAAATAKSAEMISAARSPDKSWAAPAFPWLPAPRGQLVLPNSFCNQAGGSMNVR